MVAVVAMQLVEVDLLDLDASVSTLLTEVELPSEVRVRHLLSHTSEGIVGREYVYSPERYGLPLDSAVSGPVPGCSRN